MSAAPQMDPGPRPEVGWIAVDRLTVDHSYQRTLDSSRSKKLVRAIAARFRWSAFQAILTTPVDDGPDGLLRFVISERDPGVANWLECTGHRRGYVQIRWQRLTRDLGPGDGPRVEVVKLADLPSALPYHKQAQVTPGDYAARIAARQAAIAARMLG